MPFNATTILITLFKPKFYETMKNKLNYQSLILEKIKKQLLFFSLLTLGTSAGVFSQSTNFNLMVQNQSDETIYTSIENQGPSDMAIQEITITGQVTEAATGQPLPGVSIIIKGTTIGTTTNVDGQYSLSNVPSDAILVFSFIGMRTQEVAVDNRTRINIDLDSETIGIDEVVAVGYGTQRRVNLTGAISSVDAEQISTIPSSTMSNLIGGRAPGVNVTAISGLAGATSDIRIRGSFAEPLYVINGVIRGKADFDALNPNEVESINFLKDAASASIYGSAAGNGVVLVTTKTGIVQKPVFEYSTTYSLSQPTQPIQTYSALQEIDYMNNVAVTRGQEMPFGQDVRDYFQNRSYVLNDLIWQDPTIQQHNLSVRGGTEEISYFASFGYHKENGSYKNLEYDRYNFRTDITARITDRFNVNVNLGGQQRDYDRWYWPYDGAEDFNVGDFYRSTFNWSRLRPFYVDAQGNPTNDPSDYPIMPGGFHIPELMFNGGYRDTKYRSIDGIINFNLDLGQFIDGLNTSFRGSYSASDRNMKSHVVHNRFFLPTIGSTTNPYIPGPIDLNQRSSHNLSAPYENIQEVVNLYDGYQINWDLRYDQTFGDHAVSALAVYEVAGSNGKGLSGQARDLLSSNIDQIYNASGDVTMRLFTGGESQDARVSYIGRLNYNYAGRYIAEFAFRYDGNYFFAPERRWGFFPSGSLAWRISEESFMEDLIWLSNLKLRGSYGTTGSVAGIGPWRWTNVYNKTTGFVFGNTLLDGLTPGAMPNPDITWSTITLWNVGLEWGVLNNRLRGELDVWAKTEADILGTRLGTTPTTLGAGLPAVNYAERSWKGYEISANWDDRAGDIRYGIYANMGYAVDQWDIWDEPEALIDGTYQDNWRSRIGKPNNRLGGYIVVDMIRTQEQLDALPEGFTQFGREPVLGTLLFKDIRGANYSEGADGKIDGNDWTYLSDNAIPRINFGLGLNFEWRGFSVNAHFQGVGAYDRMARTRNGQGVFQVDRPYFEIWATDYWTPETPNATYPRVGQTWMQPEFGGGPSTFWIKNGAYIRLRNLNLGYSLPQAWYSNLGVSNIRIFANGTNLFYLSKFNWYDPEQTTLDSYPIMKSFTGGININF